MSEPGIHIDDLSIEERIDLIDRLWESVSSIEPPLTPEQLDELDRRLDELDEEGAVGLSLEELNARLDRHRR